MTTDLLFATALPQKLPSSFQCDHNETSWSSSATRTTQPGWSTDARPENFLATLKRVARDQNTSTGSQQPASPEASHSDVTVQHAENDLEADVHLPGEEILMELMALLNPDEYAPADQSPLSAELSELISLLEALGWTGTSGNQTALDGGRGSIDLLEFLGWTGTSGNQTALDGGRGSIDNLLGSAQNLQEMLSTIKAGNNVLAGMQQLRQIIAGVLASDSSALNPDKAPYDPAGNQAQALAELVRWAKSAIQGQDHAVPTNAAAAGDGSSAEKPLAPATVVKDTAIIETGGQHHRLSGSENSDNADANKSTPEIRISAGAGGPAGNLKDAKSPLGHNPDNNGADQASAQATNGSRKIPAGHSILSAADAQHPGAEPQKETALRGDSPPVSKAGDDVTANRDNSLKVDPILNGDAGSKIVKPEGGTHDGGQWTAQGHTSERSLETVSTSREAEGARRELQSHTMEQIVRRAVFQIKNGQQEARIDLKPDFLGHVRMQVITDNHQVTVKIVTEFGFVKDILENNIQQLKADLQQQGLEVDKLDVSVSRDSNGQNSPKENMEHAKNRFRENNTANDGPNHAEGQQDPAERILRKAQGLSTVDYFA